MRKPIQAYAYGGKVIEPGIHADSLLEIMSKDMMTRPPETIGNDADGLIVEWWYKGVVFTLARASVYDPFLGDERWGYHVQLIEETDE